MGVEKRRRGGDFWQVGKTARLRRLPSPTPLWSLHFSTSTTKWHQMTPNHATKALQRALSFRVAPTWPPLPKSFVRGMVCVCAWAVNAVCAIFCWDGVESIRRCPIFCLSIPCRLICDEAGGCKEKRRANGTKSFSFFGRSFLWFLPFPVSHLCPISVAMGQRPLPPFPSSLFLSFTPDDGPRRMALFHSLARGSRRKMKG